MSAQQRPLAGPQSALAERILDALPQTQCTRCGYPDCAAYAQAIATGAADINQCPPGGAEGIARLSQITNLPSKPLGAEFGVEAPRTVAVIDEQWCIGCTLCIAACPVDAIVGSNKRMHTVIEPHCTGCELCLPVCPVDCIVLENVSGEATGWTAWSAGQADTARKRYTFHSSKTKRDEDESTQRLIAKAELKLSNLVAHSQHTDAAVLDKKRAVIEAALARARSKATTLQSVGSPSSAAPTTTPLSSNVNSNPD